MSLLRLVPVAAPSIPDLCCHTDTAFILSPPHRSENNFDMELELEALLEVCRQSCCTWEALDLFANGFAVINLSCPLWSHPCNLQADGRTDEGMPDMALPGNSLALTKGQPELVPSALETKVQQSAPELQRDAAPALCIPEPACLEPVVEVSNISSPLRLCLGSYVGCFPSLPLCTFRMAPSTPLRVLRRPPRMPLLHQSPQQ